MLPGRGVETLPKLILILKEVGRFKSDSYPIWPGKKASVQSDHEGMELTLDHVPTMTIATSLLLAASTASAKPLSSSYPLVRPQP